MPLDVLFVRDDDIPDLVQEDICDLGLVGLNVIDVICDLVSTGSTLAADAHAARQIIDAVRRGGQ